MPPITKYLSIWSECFRDILNESYSDQRETLTNLCAVCSAQCIGISILYQIFKKEYVVFILLLIYMCVCACVVYACDEQKVFSFQKRIYTKLSIKYLLIVFNEASL